MGNDESTPGAGTGRRRSRRLSVAAVIVGLMVAGAGCSTNSVEAGVRADLAASGLSDESIECLLDAFDLEELGSGQVGAGTLIPDAATSECVGAVFAEMFADAFEGAFDDLSIDPGDVSYGDGPSRDDMDELVESCRAGDNEACDDLWLVSPIGSPEEDLAESCGGRSEEPLMGSCAFWLD